jgi:hypothetical protein
MVASENYNDKLERCWRHDDCLANSHTNLCVLHRKSEHLCDVKIYCKNLWRTVELMSEYCTRLIFDYIYM